MPEVYNLKKFAPRDAVYIGRGSPWGNPYIIGKHGTRNEVIELYRRKILPKLDVTPLIGKNLKCYCSPLACHGDLLLEACMLKHNVGRNKDRRLDGFYSTPEIYTEWLLENEEFEEEICEVACGDGRMAKVLKAEGYHVVATDLHKRGYGAKKDFFDIKVCRNIVTNPPFELAEEFIHHALAICPGKVCMLLRLNFLESQGRYRRLWRKRPPARVYVASQRVSMMPAIMRANGKMKAANAISYAWFVWDGKSKVTELRWLRPR
jgi:uncharacterized protein DUF4326